jgi:hypothetical protein
MEIIGFFPPETLLGRPGAAAATKEREKYPHDQSYRTEIDFPTFKEQYGCADSTSTL